MRELHLEFIHCYQKGQLNQFSCMIIYGCLQKDGTDASNADPKSILIEFLEIRNKKYENYFVLFTIYVRFRV